MNDPVSLSTVSTTVLTEGIKFLYAQAGEALKHWRTRKRQIVESENTTELLDVTLPPDVFEAEPSAPRCASFDYATVERLEDPLKELRYALADYAQDIEAVDPTDKRLIAATEGLRQIMEAVYGMRLTLQGEQREHEGRLEVRGYASADEVYGYVAGLRARKILGGSVGAIAVARQVKEGGRLTAIDVETISDERQP